MKERPLSIQHARQTILELAASPATSSPLSDGRVQTRVDTGEIIDRLCRRDACGKISRRDRDTVYSAIRQLEVGGILAGELNGHPLAVDRGYPARRALRERCA